MKFTVDGQTVEITRGAHGWVLRIGRQWIGSYGDRKTAIGRGIRLAAARAVALYQVSGISNESGPRR